MPSWRTPILGPNELTPTNPKPKNSLPLISHCFGKSFALYEPVERRRRLVPSFSAVLRMSAPLDRHRFRPKSNQHRRKLYRIPFPTCPTRRSREADKSRSRRRHVGSCSEPTCPTMTKTRRCCKRRSNCSFCRNGGQMIEYR